MKLSVIGLLSVGLAGPGYAHHSNDYHFDRNVDVTVKFLGLHEYSFASPALTYVRPDLEQHLGYLDGLGIQFAFRKTGEDIFNEAGFCDPDGQMVALLEARTFSPPTFESESFTVCGHFDEFSLPVRSLPEAIDFWEPLGFVMTSRADTAPASATLTSDGINLGLYEARAFTRPAVSFREPDMPERVEYLRGQGLDLTEQSPGIGSDGAAHTVLLGPEGLQLFLASE